MGYTFAVNSEEISSLAETLGTTKTNVGSGIEGIFSDIDGMEGESWAGSSYTTFHDGAHQYQEALTNVPEVIGAFQQTLQESVGPAETAVTSINDSINSI